MKALLVLVLLSFVAAAECQRPKYIGSRGDYEKVRGLLRAYRGKLVRKYAKFHTNQIMGQNLRQATTSKDEATEIAVNMKIGVTEDLFEGDIMLTLPQAEEMLNELSSREKRDISVHSYHFWKMPISYVMSNNDENWKNQIRQALKHIEQETCVRFEENRPSVDYLNYVPIGGCQSYIGRIGGQQELNIGPGCSQIGIIAHETLHALGVFHEQSRSDRDAFVRINYGNIAQGYEHNFEKNSYQYVVNLDQPYDFGSVMHYASEAFAANRDVHTIMDHENLYDQTMGYRWSLSFKDAKLVNTHYCKATCPTKLSCERGGYTDPNDCSKCKCPPGFAGRTCAQLQQSSGIPGCGGELIARGYALSLDFSTDMTNVRCYWRIKAERPHLRVGVNVDNADIGCKNNCNTYLEVKYKNDFVKTGVRISHNDFQRRFFVSEGNELIVIFASNEARRRRTISLKYHEQN